MDKRNVMKGIVAGTLALFAAGSGGKSVFAAEPDWRDELLSGYDYFSFYNNYETEPHEIDNGEIVMRMTSSTILNLYKEDDKWVIGHFYNVYIPDVEFPNDRISTNLEGAYTKFDSLKEAYLYGKELKARHYG